MVPCPRCGCGSRQYDPLRAAFARAERNDLGVSVQMLAQCFPQKPAPSIPHLREWIPKAFVDHRRALASRMTRCLATPMLLHHLPLYCVSSTVNVALVQCNPVPQRRLAHYSPDQCRARCAWVLSSITSRLANGQSQPSMQSCLGAAHRRKLLPRPNSSSSDDLTATALSGTSRVVLNQPR